MNTGIIDAILLLNFHFTAFFLRFKDYKSTDMERNIKITKNLAATIDVKIPIENRKLISERYISNFFFLAFFWILLILGFILTIDPYRVSPIHIKLPRINSYKPKRLDIDRLIKPYEVWRYQPKTIFLGTSRIHQSIDPTFLDGTDFAPAYNAAVPASTLSQNAAFLEEYFQHDKNLHYVFIELFIYNFIIPQPEVSKKTFKHFLETTSALFVSADALLNSFQTLVFNLSGRPIGPYISPRGNWIRPKNFDTSATFDHQLYIDTIINIHKSIPDMIIQPSAMDSLNRIVELCKKHNAKLFMIITPNYPWDDYRLLSLGYWPLVEEWIKKMSMYDHVLSFSQYNRLLEEPPNKKMQWWNDPIHFSDNMGHLMLLSLLGHGTSKIPNNFFRSVTANNYQIVLQERKAGLNAWIRKNRWFAEKFDTTKKIAGNVERRNV